MSGHYVLDRLQLISCALLFAIKPAVVFPFSFPFFHWNLGQLVNAFTC